MPLYPAWSYDVSETQIFQLYINGRQNIHFFLFMTIFSVSKMYDSFKHTIFVVNVSSLQGIKPWTNFHMSHNRNNCSLCVWSFVELLRYTNNRFSWYKPGYYIQEGKVLLPHPSQNSMHRAEVILILITYRGAGKYYSEQRTTRQSTHLTSIVIGVFRCKKTNSSVMTNKQCKIIDVHDFETHIRS